MYENIKQLEGNETFTLRIEPNYYNLKKKHKDSGVTYESEKLTVAMYPKRADVSLVSDEIPVDIRDLRNYHGELEKVTNPMISLTKDEAILLAKLIFEYYGIQK